MRIRPFRAVYPNLDYVTSPDEFFGTVREKYPAYKESGFFQRTAQESIYIYQIVSQKRTHTGIIACTDIHDYLDGKIKKHENTLAAKEQQQMHLILARGAIVKPILLTYPDVPSLNKLIKKIVKEQTLFYEVQFEKTGHIHRFWEVKDGQLIEQFQQLFQQKVPISYIADGHHRTSTTALMYKRMLDRPDEPDYDQMLCTFFPVSELAVHDYNRIIESSPDISITTFMAKIAQVFDIEILDGPQKPTAKHEIVMYVNREWFRLQWKKEILKEYKKATVILDATLLNEKVLENILGIMDVRTDLRVRYVEGPKGLNEIRQKTNKDDSRVGFVLYPVELSDLMKVADAGEVMPPKSTWFEPRIKNGLIVQEL